MLQDTFATPVQLQKLKIVGNTNKINGFQPVVQLLEVPGKPVDWCNFNKRYSYSGCCTAENFALRIAQVLRTTFKKHFAYAGQPERENF